MPDPGDKVITLKRSDYATVLDWNAALSALFDDAAKHKQSVQYAGSTTLDEHSYAVGYDKKKSR